MSRVRDNLRYLITFDIGRLRFGSEFEQQIAERKRVLSLNSIRKRYD